MRTVPVAARSLVVLWVLATALLSYLLARVGAALRGRGRDAARRDALRGRALARAFERLGATFVKLGQIVATRPDVLPPGITTALEKLHDDVPPAPFAEVERVLARELPPDVRGRLVSIDPLPVAAASVAQVHRGELDDGTVVAIKVQRAAAADQIERDLAIFAFGARLLDRLPQMKWVSLPGAVERFAAALRAQLDFELEARNNRRLAKNFAGDARVRVPVLHDALCSRRVLTMEFIDGVKPTEVLEGREELAMAGLRCIAQMVFLDGFVHADMHPGNMLLSRDGHVVLIDLGLVAEIPEPMRKAWVETFVAVAACDGATAARLFYEHAPAVGDDTDYDAFEAEVIVHLDAMKGRPLAELEVTGAVGGAMSILRRHHVQVDPSFTVVQLAMLVAEGVGKQLDPTLDIVGSVGPYLAQAAARWTTGAAPRRKAPARPADPTES
jgi:ubiquinone biosynthesis protein